MDAAATEKLGIIHGEKDSLTGKRCVPFRRWYL